MNKLPTKMYVFLFSPPLPLYVGFVFSPVNIEKVTNRKIIYIIIIIHIEKSAVSIFTDTVDETYI